MNINLEESPWLQVHFTLPNETTKRRLVNYTGERRRIKNAIQGKQSFLAAKSKKNRRNEGNANRFGNYRKQQKSLEKEGNINNSKNIVELSNLNDITAKQNSVFIDNSTEMCQEKRFTLPPLDGASTSLLSCQGQRSKSTNTGNLRDKQTEQSNQNYDKCKTLSIATCYDLYEWKPSTSVCHKPSRPLASILKQNPSEKEGDGPRGQTIDNSDTSGYETDNERTSKATKRVRFAKGTIFHSSKGRRPRRIMKENNPGKVEVDNDFGEADMLDSLDGIPFSEFIQRKRLERSLASRNTCKTRNHLTFLKEESYLLKRHQNKKHSKHDIHSMQLPTIIN